MTDIHSLTAQAVALLQRLIATPRTSRNEQAAADLLQHFMQHECQLQVQREGNNLWSIAPGYDPARQTLLLNAHIDTVKPTASWTRDPFTPAIDGDRLYGLGSNDDGASLVSLLMAFCVASSQPSQLSPRQAPDCNLIFLASAEEEVSGKNGIERALPLLPHIDVALVGEPTGMQPAVAEKGLMVLDCVAHGRSGHAARDEGDNAILRAMRDIECLQSGHLFPRVSPLLGAVKTSVTIINAGTQHNVVPDRCTFTIDVRSNELYSNTEILHLLQSTLESTLTPRSTRLSSSCIDQQHWLVQRITALGRTPFGSPTLSDQALLPCPSLKMGPGDSRRSHTADEFICLSEIEEAIALYLQVLGVS